MQGNSPPITAPAARCALSASTSARGSPRTGRRRPCARARRRPTTRAARRRGRSTCGARRSPRNIHVAAAASLRLRGTFTSQPRLRCVSAEYPRRSRGVAATRLRHVRAAKMRLPLRRVLTGDACFVEDLRGLGHLQTISVEAAVSPTILVVTIPVAVSASSRPRDRRGLGVGHDVVAGTTSSRPRGRRDLGVVAASASPRPRRRRDP